MSSPPPIPAKNDAARFDSPYPSPHYEHLGHYYPGGLHPIALGDKLNDGKYTVIAKLGRGAFSTAWLAQDNQTSLFVAIKISHAVISPAIARPAQEAELFRRAGESPYLLRILDEFHVQGPNGTHHCLVSEVAAGNIAMFRRSRFECQYDLDLPLSDGGVQTIPAYQLLPWMAKKAAMDILHALDHLHSNGIVHGDLNEGNLLVSANMEGYKLTEEPLKRLVKRHDGKIDPWAPAFLYAPQVPTAAANMGEAFLVKLADLASAFRENSPPSLHDLMLGYGLTPPESLLSISITSAIDIWSFGCLFYGMLTGHPLFVPLRTLDISGSLMCIQRTLGILPQAQLDAWATAIDDREEWFDANNQLHPIHLRQIGNGLSLEVRLQKEKPAGLDQDDVDGICQFLRCCFVFDPQERPSAKELLQHPYMIKIAATWEASALATEQECRNCQPNFKL